MSRPRVVSVLAGVLGVGAGLAFLGWRALHEAPPAGAGGSVDVRIESGEGLRTIAARLEESELVVSASRFRWLARLRGEDRGIHAGTYRFERGASPGTILDDLVTGRVRLERLTIPEGWRLDQIAAEAEKALGVPADSVRVVAASEEWRERLECPAATLEGYLYPETYFFPDGVTAEEVVRAMTDRFLEVWEEVDRDHASDLDRHQAVTLASIIEAETSVDSERTRIAAVYSNRLKEGWRLEADPTVRYALGKFTGRLYYKHLDVESPYNTYRNQGLPPGPIAAPGEASLRAALSPLEPCDDFYFVASRDGGHVFSKTKREHDRAKREFRGGG